MTDNRLAEGLMKQDGIDASEVSAEDREALQRILARERARTRRMKWFTLGVWFLVLMAFVVFGALERAVRQTGAPDYSVSSMLVHAAPPFVMALFWIAAIFTISYGVRAILFRNRQIEVRVAQMEVELAGIRATLEKRDDKG